MKDSIIRELYANAVSRAELIVPEGSEYMESRSRGITSESTFRAAEGAFRKFHSSMSAGTENRG